MSVDEFTQRCIYDLVYLTLIAVSHPAFDTFKLNCEVGRAFRTHLVVTHLRSLFILCPDNILYIPTDIVCQSPPYFF